MKLKPLNSHEKVNDSLGSHVICRVWALDSKTFRRIRNMMASHILASSTNEIKFFKSIKYFKHLKSHDLQDIVNCARLTVFKKDDKIIEEGIYIHFCIILKSNLLNLVIF